MTDVFVVTDGVKYLDWDDRGPMATGYPNWTLLARAKQYDTRVFAEAAAEAAWKCDKGKSLFIETLTLVTHDRQPFIPAEADPEWKDYQRLKQKFRHR